MKEGKLSVVHQIISVSNMIIEVFYEERFDSYWYDA